MARRRLVSPMARIIESVRAAAYLITRPSTLRAARNVDGRVIMYADAMTESMEKAIGETNRRRALQQAYNEEHGIVPKSVSAAVHELMEISRPADEDAAMAAAGLDKQVSQYFTVLTGAHSVGVMGDERTYAYAVALRAVTTDDFMTADVARLPYDLLGRVATRIVGEVAGCNRVLYDITTKPPASIEWE